MQDANLIWAKTKIFIYLLNYQHQNFKSITLNYSINSDQWVICCRLRIVVLKPSVPRGIQGTISLTTMCIMRSYISEVCWGMYVQQWLQYLFNQHGYLKSHHEIGSANFTPTRIGSMAIYTTSSISHVCMHQAFASWKRTTITCEGTVLVKPVACCANNRTPLNVYVEPIISGIWNTVETLNISKLLHRCVMWTLNVNLFTHRYGRLQLECNEFVQATCIAIKKILTAVFL